MTRYRLTIEFDGADYAGWQLQVSGVPTVQQALQDAIQSFSGQQVVVHGAGRTDAGVHAFGMVAHVDVEDTDANMMRKAVNAQLRPQAIAVLHAEEVSSDFHARFSCIERRYLYRIVSRRAPIVLNRGRVWQLYTPLDTPAMADCAALLVGRHDFSTFRAAACQADGPIKTLDSLSLEVIEGEFGPEIQVRARARSFLHHQVRNMVGSLVKVGLGRWSPRGFTEAFAAKDRRRGGQTAPSEGLYFMGARYPGD